MDDRPQDKEKAKRPASGDKAADRHRRQAEALRANLQRRKAQMRGRIGAGSGQDKGRDGDG